MVQSIRKLNSTISGVEILGSGLARVDLQGDNIGTGIAPGAFAMVQAPGRPDCILFRPYSYFFVAGPNEISLLLRDVGSGTHALMSSALGTSVEILGPLGNGFSLEQQTIWAVAGGVGAAPFGMMGKHKDLTVLFGARSNSDSGFAKALGDVGIRTELATDDGSVGFKGSVVDLLRMKLSESPHPDVLFTCGPTPMMAAVAQVANEFNVPCWASLEERMGCGIGICRGCVQRDVEGKIICLCVDGPVYQADRIFAMQ